MFRQRFARTQLCRFFLVSLFSSDTLGASREVGLGDLRRGSAIRPTSPQVRTLDNNSQGGEDVGNLYEMPQARTWCATANTAKLFVYRYLKVPSGLRGHGTVNACCVGKWAVRFRKGLNGESHEETDGGFGCSNFHGCIEHTR